MKTFIVVGWQCWGRGFTIREAKKAALECGSREARKDKFYAYMFDDEKAYVSTSGFLRYEGECVRLGEI